jgi:peptidoglycan/xylan/chitin deacetylase (PgdA/CDA1 family)
MIKLLTSLTQKKIIVPFYHTVAEEPLPHVKNLYQMKTIKEFLIDVDFFLKHFEPIDVETLHNFHINKTVSKKPVFHLTFDDGMKEMYEIVAPILLKKGIPATFFINSVFVDNKALFYRHRESLEIEGIQVDDFLKKEKPYLTTKQIKELSKKGFTIGAHSIDHPYYYKIPLDEQLRQTRESLDFVSSIIDQKLKLFAFPFTDFNVSKQFFKEIKPDVDLCFGTAGLKKEVIPFNIQRICAEKGTINRVLKKEFLKYLGRFFLPR